MSKDFKITQFEPKTLSWWRARKNQIDMDPPYQRAGKIWSDADKAYLIDSIINGYDIPKLYLADFTWGDTPLNKRKLPYAIIDGKQRFESIFDFFEDKITLNSDFEYVKDPKLKLGGLAYKDLQKNYREIAEEFDNYSLTIMRVQAASEEPIQELFVRLNRGKALTGAEIRNAMAGPARDVIKRISGHDFFRLNVKFSVKRGADLNAAAKILLFEFHADVKETKKSNLDNFVRTTSDLASKDRLALAGRFVIDNLDIMGEIFLPKDKLLGSSGNVPLYYWFIRNIGAEKYHRVREFLVLFERARAKYRGLMQSASGDRRINNTLALYDRYMRSPNDSQSYKGRYDILNKAFEKPSILK